MKTALSLIGILLILFFVTTFLGQLTAPKENSVPEAASGYRYHATTATYEVVADVVTSGNAVLDSAVKIFIDGRIAQFETEYNPSKYTPDELSFLGFAERGPYQLYATGTVSSYAALTSTLIETYMFTGGAHGGTTYTSFTYVDAQPLSLRDLFAQDTKYLSRVAQEVQSRLKMQLENAGVFASEEFDAGTAPTVENYQTFTVGPDGITFVFQQYQVGPYVIGAPRVTVPFEAFTGVLNPVYFGASQ